MNLEAAETYPNASMPEEAKELRWGSSLPVPSVQEMVKKNSLTVPERYIQDLKDRPNATSFSEPASQVPIINFSFLANGDEDELERLDLACREWGFFQLIDHGVPVEVLQKMKAAVAAFFNLPLEEKKKYAMGNNDIQGYGQAFVVSEEQKLEWCDMLFLTVLPKKHKLLQYWPLVLQGFSEAVDGYAVELRRLNDLVLANLSVLMGLEKDALKKPHGEMTQAIRMNYYPPCARPDAVLGVSPHSDAVTITFLLQDDEISGLQIRHNGGWVPVTPIPNAIVVNIGDVLEAWSNGLYKSIEHRAVTNETAGRMSIATFTGPNREVEIGPLDTMVDNLNRSRMYKSIKYSDYCKHKFSTKLDGKASIDFLKI